MDDGSGHVTPVAHYPSISLSTNFSFFKMLHSFCQMVLLLTIVSLGQSLSIATAEVSLAVLSHILGINWDLRMRAVDGVSLFLA